MKKAITKPEMDMKKLEKICGTKERTLFFLTWLRHGRNATKAYMELHPEVTERSAGVLGSKTLGNIDIKLVAQAYGLDTDKYFDVLKNAMNADKWNDFTGEREKDYRTIKPYHDKLGKILGIETKDNNTNIQINMPILGKEEAE